MTSPTTTNDDKAAQIAQEAPQTGLPGVLARMRAYALLPAQRAPSGPESEAEEIARHQHNAAARRAHRDMMLAHAQRTLAEAPSPLAVAEAERTIEIIAARDAIMAVYRENLSVIPEGGRA